MNTEWERLGKHVKPNPGWHKLKAHIIRSDGMHEELAGDGIYIEFDQERGILIALQEHSDYGLYLRSQPQEEIDENSFKPGKSGMLFSAPFRSSHLVLRSGGSNVFYVSPIAEMGRAIKPPDKSAI